MGFSTLWFSELWKVLLLFKWDIISNFSIRFEKNWNEHRWILQNGQLFSAKLVVASSLYEGMCVFDK